jgi:hypothetical protein
LFVEVTLRQFIDGFADAAGKLSLADMDAVVGIHIRVAFLAFGRRVIKDQLLPLAEWRVMKGLRNCSLCLESSGRCHDIPNYPDRIS